MLPMFREQVSVTCVGRLLAHMQLLSTTLCYRYEPFETFSAGSVSSNVSRATGDKHA